MKANKKQFYTFQEVADMIRVSRQTIYNMHNDGRLHAVKFGREYKVSAEDLQKFIKTGKC